MRWAKRLYLDPDSCDCTHAPYYWRRPDHLSTCAGPPSSGLRRCGGRATTTASDADERTGAVALCTAVLCPPGVTCLSCTHHVYDTNLFCFGAKEKGNKVKLRCMTINKPVNHADLSSAHFYPHEGSHCTNPSTINVKNGLKKKQPTQKDQKNLTKNKH